MEVKNEMRAFGDLSSIFNEVKEKTNKMIDKYTIELFEIAGIKLKKDYTIWDVTCAKNLLENKGYRMIFVDKFTTKNNFIQILLYKGNEFISGYEFSVYDRSDDGSIKIIPVKILMHSK